MLHVDFASTTNMQQLKGKLSYSLGSDTQTIKIQIETVIETSPSNTSKSKIEKTAVGNFEILQILNVLI